MVEGTGSTGHHSEVEQQWGRGGRPEGGHSQHQQEWIREQTTNAHTKTLFILLIYRTTTEWMPRASKLLE